MAVANEIISASGYTGTPQLGGSLGIGVTLDTTPINRLATFTYYKDRDQWEQQQKDNANAARQIANISAFDVNSPLKPYTDDLTKELNGLQDYVRNNKDALTYDPKNPQKYIDLQTKIGQFEVKRVHATSNDALYNARKTQVDQIADPAERVAQQKILDLSVNKLFANGIDSAYANQFETVPTVKADDYTVPEIPLTEKFTITRGDNEITTRGFKYADLNRAMAQADAVYFGLKKPLDTNSAEFKALPPDQQQQTILQDSITSKPRVNLQNITDSLNNLVSGLKTTMNNPDLKVADIPQDVLSKSPTVGGIISSAKQYNDQVDVINSRTGEQYSHINLDDGASPQEMLLLQAFQKNKNSLFSEVEPKIINTNDKLEEDRIKAENYRAQLTQNGENYRANLPYEKLKLQATADAGKDFGNIIYGVNSNQYFLSRSRVPFKGSTDKMKIVNGAIVGEDGQVLNEATGDFTIPASYINNSIVTEFNKYSGAQKYDQSTGKIIQEASSSRLEKDDSGNYTVRFKNGIIDGIKTNDGTFATADQFQTITTQASQKGATKYKKPEDISGGNKGPETSATPKSKTASGLPIF